MRAPKDHDVDCWNCKYYFITHDASFPYGCNAMGFKSRIVPCKEVLAASGERCLQFQKKPAKQEG